MTPNFWGITDEFLSSGYRQKSSGIEETMPSLRTLCTSNIPFADLPFCRWRDTRRGLVKPQHALTERQYYLYDEKARYIMAIHEDALDSALELEPLEPAQPPEAASEETKT